MIRNGENYSFIELSLYLPQNENSIDGNIIVSREIYSNGKNSCKVNGRLVTVNQLKDFMNEIIDIHGQNDTQKLMNKQEHIKYLDQFIGDSIFSIKKEYHNLFLKYIDIKKQLKENYGDEKERERKLDLLKYQLKEINQSSLREGEEEELEDRRKMLLNSEKISKNLIQADNYLNGNAVDCINMAIRSLEKIEEFNFDYKDKLSQLKNIYYDIQEVSRDISFLKDNNEFNEVDRNEIEERLDLIHSLKRKYGNDINEILNYKNQLEEEILKIENVDKINEKLEKELNIITNRMKLKTKEMNEIRKIKSYELIKQINNQLKDLEMQNAKFNVLIKEIGNFNENGNDDVEFVICTNVGEEEKSLIKTASGGEISRIMLAIKTVLADSDKVPIMIFDEIDTGISGKAAKSVAEKMKIISKKHQVLCITHQANIAAKGDYNYYISKNIKNENTVTNIKLLTEEEVINEIARISSGDITENAINHAREMRKAV